MRIGEAAAKVGLTTRALRYYEQQGLVETARSSSGQREYDDRDVERLRTVRGLRDAGLTMADVSALVDDLDQDIRVPPVDVCADGAATDCALTRVTSQRLSELDTQISSLVAQRDRLADARQNGFVAQTPPGPRSPQDL